MFQSKTQERLKKKKVKKMIFFFLVLKIKEALLGNPNSYI